MNECLCSRLCSALKLLYWILIPRNKFNSIENTAGVVYTLQLSKVKWTSRFKMFACQIKISPELFDPSTKISLSPSNTIIVFHEVVYFETQFWVVTSWISEETRKNWISVYKNTFQELLHFVIIVFGLMTVTNSMSCFFIASIIFIYLIRFQWCLCIFLPLLVEQTEWKTSLRQVETIIAQRKHAKYKVNK